MKEADYPLFIPILPILRMIDSTLDEPFFARNKDGKLITDELDVDFYSQRNCDYLVRKKAYERILISKVNSKVSKESLNMKLLSYETFEKIFWKEQKKNFYFLSPLTVWCEIMSFIKGSVVSFEGKDFHMDKDTYLSYVGVHKSYVTSNEKNLIFDIAKNYEIWKSNEKMFDMMDLVSYLLEEVTQVN